MAGGRAYTDEEVEAAVQALTEPGRLDAAQRAVVAQAPQLQRILDEALKQAEWFGSAHHDAVRKATAHEEPLERSAAVSALLAEETRLSMLIGVAVGMELRHLLEHPRED